MRIKWDKIWTSFSRMTCYCVWVQSDHLWDLFPHLFIHLLSTHLTNMNWGAAMRKLQSTRVNKIEMVPILTYRIIEVNDIQVNSYYSTVRCTRFQVTCKQYTVLKFEDNLLLSKLTWIENNTYYTFTLIYLQSTKLFLFSSKEGKVESLCKNIFSQEHHMLT